MLPAASIGRGSLLIKRVANLYVWRLRLMPLHFDKKKAVWKKQRDCLSDIAAFSHMLLASPNVFFTNARPVEVVAAILSYMTTQAESPVSAPRR